MNVALARTIVEACTGLAPTLTPTLTPVEQAITCATCDGLEFVVTGQAADGCIHDAPCPNPECYLGVVRNPDWEPGLCTCSCGHALLPGDDCGTCHTHYQRTAA